FRLIKKMEHSWKALVHDGVCTGANASVCVCVCVCVCMSVCVCIFVLLTFFFSFQDTVSVHRPNFYAERFLKFMGLTVFKKIH
ncbi:unnamed protein product, partial [Tetraodon nigroviridis]